MSNKLLTGPYLFFCWAIFFIIGVWFIQWNFEIGAQEIQVYWNLTFISLLGIPYYFLWSNKISPPSWKWGVFLSFLMAFLTPVIIQTDQFRYVWDGLLQTHRINPYQYSPLEKLTSFPQWGWGQLINHPHLKSIYPPIAQVIFWISTYFNPFMWGEGYLNLVPFKLGHLNLFQVTFGLKVLIGIGGGLLCWALKNKNWALVIFHPLFLTLGLGNGHIDFWMVLLFSIFFHPTLFRNFKDSIQWPILTLLILTKWVPFVLAPLFFISSLKKWGLKKSLTGIILALGLGSFIIALYANGRPMNFFESLFIYGKSWYFFGYLHRFLSDLIYALGNWPYLEALQLGKYLSMVLGLFSGMALLLLSFKEKISFALGSLLIFVALFAFSPTLHPWYLLPLLILGLPYRKVFLTPFVWPFLALYSQYYFVINRDPIILRYAVYSLVSLCLIKDYFTLVKRKPFKQRPTSTPLFSS